MKAPLFRQGGRLGWRLALIILLGIVSTQIVTVLVVTATQPTRFILFRLHDIADEILAYHQQKDIVGDIPLLHIEYIPPTSAGILKPLRDTEPRAMHADFRKQLRDNIPGLSDADIDIWVPRLDWQPLGPLRQRPRAVVAGKQDEQHVRPAPSMYLIPATFQMTLRLPEGGGLLVSAADRYVDTGIWPRWLLVILWFVAMVAIVSLLAMLASRHLIRPLGRIAQAADGWRAEVKPHPLPEDGPAEFRAIARAFNAMRENIHCYIRERTEMVMALSHDLRTPLTRLRLRTEYVEDAEQRQRSLDDLRFMERITEQLLTFATYERQEEAMERVDIAALLQTLCDDHADAGIAIEYEGPRRYVLRCRPTAIHRTFMNLIDNAAKYSEYSLVHLERKAGGVTVTIADSGPGIPESELEAVLRPFYRVDAARAPDTGGLGMGLHVANRVVQDHGGRLVLRNRKPENPDAKSGGLEVEVYLPRN